MIIDCISDLHGHYPKLDGGDLLIVAGDLTAKDDIDEYFGFFKWLHQQEYNRISVIAGNHDNKFRDGYIVAYATNGMLDAIDILSDSGTEFEGLKMWGSPWTKTFPGMNPKCKAFTVDTEEELEEKWSLIPNDVDILITHSPPFGIFDKSIREEYCGSKSLRNMLLSSQRFPKLKLHIFGHIHEQGGKILDTALTKFVNASHVNERYQPVNKPIRIILGEKPESQEVESVMDSHIESLDHL